MSVMFVRDGEGWGAGEWGAGGARRRREAMKVLGGAVGEVTAEARG